MSVEDLTTAASRLPFGGDSLSGESPPAIDPDPTAGPESAADPEPAIAPDYPSPRQTDTPRGRPGFCYGRSRRRGGRTAAGSSARSSRRVDTTIPRDVETTLRGLCWFARCIAASRGHAVIIERAGGSESTYIHVRRRHDGGPPFWFGIRLSTHAAVYACSHDYAQMLLPKPHHTDPVANITTTYEPSTYEPAVDWADFRSVLADEICQGGLVVADPAEVRRQIDWESIRTCRGEIWSNGAADYRFEIDPLGWRAIGDPDTANDYDLPFPQSSLSVGQTASIRHRENWREKWVAATQGVPAELTETPMLVYDARNIERR